MGLDNSHEESLLLKSIALDLEQYLVNTLRSHELSQKTGVVDPRIADFTKRSLNLVDTYLLHKSYVQGQLSLAVEPMNLGAVLTQVDYEIKQLSIVPQTNVILDKKQSLVSSDFRIVKEIIKNLAMFLASFEDNQSSDRKITMQSYNDGEDVKVGVFSEVSLSAENFSADNLIKAKATMPLSVQSSSAVPEYYLATLLSQLIGKKLQLTKRKNLYGFSLSLDHNQQLRLI